MNLFPHQEAGIEWLTRHPRGGLFDEQGLGKTVQAITAADKLGLRKLLVVVPSAVLYNWRREVKRWSADRPVQMIENGRSRLVTKEGVVVVTHTLLLNASITEQLTGFDGVVLDEAHYFRNPTAQRTRAFFLGREAIARRFPVSWLLTGTPMPNNPTELWSMLAGIAPERLRDSKTGKLLTYPQWRDRFCVCAPTGYGRGFKIIGARNTGELKQRLDGFALRRLKAAVLDLPPIQFTTVGVEAGSLVDGGPLALHEFERELEVRRPTKLFREQGVVGMQIGSRHLSNDEIDADLMGDLLEQAKREASFSTWRRLCGIAKAEPSAELIANDLDGGVPKAIVIAHHTEVMDRLHRALAPYGVVQIRGGVSPGARDEAVRAFQEDADVRVIVLQITSGGIGVTLTAAHDVYFVEQSFVPGDNEQAADRCHRIGQKESVLVRFLSLAGSVDEVLVDILARKTQMIREVIS